MNHSGISDNDDMPHELARLGEVVIGNDLSYWLHIDLTKNHFDEIKTSSLDFASE